MSTNFAIKRSSDAGAPALSNTPGSIVNVLDWALDTTNTTSGWEIAFTATNKRVYRSRAGLRHYVRIDDTAAAGSSSSTVRAYETMTDIDTGTNGYDTSDRYCIRPGGTAYIVIRTSKWFALFVERDSTNDMSYWWVLAFGEMTPLIGTDSFCSALWAAPSSGWSSTPGYAGWTTSPHYTYGTATATSNTTVMLRGVAGNIGRQYPWMGAPATMNIASRGHTSIETFKIPISHEGVCTRAFLPYMMFLPYTSSSEVITNGDTFTANGATYEVLRMYSNSLLAIRQTDDPSEV